MRELEHARRAELVLALPVLEPMDGGGFLVADKLAIHASEEDLVIGIPRALESGL